jgi:hypothetical protein
MSRPSAHSRAQFGPPLVSLTSRHHPLILPDFLHSHTSLTIAAGIVLCVESLLFIWVHMKYTEKTPIIMSAVLGIIMAFFAYRRLLSHHSRRSVHSAESSDRTGSGNQSLLISRTITPHKCMVRRRTARGSLVEKTSLRKCIRPLSGDWFSWPG